MVFGWAGRRRRVPRIGIAIFASLLSGLTLVLPPSSAHAQIRTPADCTALASFSYPDATIDQVSWHIAGPYVASDTWHLIFPNLQAYCEVRATMTPVADSSIGIRVWLPMDSFNGRFLGTGGGGYSGNYFDSELAQGVNNGFATANTEMGLGSCGSVNVNADGCVGHPEKWKDFGWRATHLMTVFSKALIQQFYGQAPNKSYFAGCSTGGQQALMEAQRFPNDYDGILAGAPAYYRTHLHTTIVASHRASRQPATAFILPTKLDVVNQAVTAQCLRQGRGAPTDAFISDPRACNFDPASLQCPGNVDGPTCLTSDQINALNVYYQGAVNPRTGALIHPGFSRGSETSNPLALGLAVNQVAPEPLFDSLFKWVFGLTWQWQTFDFDQHLAQVDAVLAADLNATDTNLAAFRDRGGKLVMYHGWADPLLPPAGTISYYNGVTQRLYGSLAPSAQAQTRDFARLYMAPGVWHCGGSIAAGPGPSSFGGMIQHPAPSFDPQHDMLSALVNWVENGTPPQEIIATKYVNDTPLLGIQMQRPLCVFPKTAHYLGFGDPNQATSFLCADERPANYNSPSIAAVHDFDADGRSDILWRHGSGVLAIWLMNGVSVSQLGVLGTVATAWSVVGQRDLTGEGTADLIWRNADGGLSFWLMNGLQVANIAPAADVPTSWKVRGTGDLNGDGPGDLLWFDSASRATVAWLMQGAQAKSVIPFGVVSAGWRIVADNNRGDILWQDGGGNLVMWKTTNGLQTIVSAPLGVAVPAYWKIAGLGDFNGDGNSDILWRSDDGDVAIWFLNGMTLQHVIGIVRVPTAWTIAQIGDYDGDGRSDIIWTDDAGYVAGWFMEGATAKSLQLYGIVGGGWSIQAANAQ